MLTCKIKVSDIKKDWLLIDADSKTLGKLASKVADILRGKNKTYFTPHLDCGDNVVVVNAALIHLSGDKWEKKLYHRHTNYIGGIKSVKANDLRKTYPDRLLRLAVKGMLPKNKLSTHLLKNLRIYAQTDHPHQAQKLKEYKL